MKNITSSVYSFEKLRNEGYLYVDKTEFIWKLINPVGESYFLSRPRRFGKSLTLSTLKAVFEGKKELFKGLAIYDKPYDWKPYPIIHLSFADYTPVNNTLEKLNLYLLRKVKEIAKEAYERKTGARGIRSIMEKVMTKVMFEIPSDDTIKECRITKDAILGLSEPVVTRE